MRMSVMKIRGMWMAVAQWLMLMAMTMWTTGRIIGEMIMLVVLIMFMRVFVFFGYMQMLVAMSFAEMKPKSDRHEDARNSQRP